MVKRLLNTSNVSLLLSNKFKNKIDTSNLVVSVVKDAYPSIQVEEIVDTVSDGLRFFSGTISDDYGLQNLTFAYSIISEKGKRVDKKMTVKKVFGVDLPFDFAVDFRREDVKLNDRIEYYFIVSDNDGVNGSKATKSQLF